MAEYDTLPNEDEGIVLKKARAKSKGGMLTDNVQAGGSVLPNARSAYQTNDPAQLASQLFQKGSEIYDQHLQKEQTGGEGAMLNALAAQYAGEGFAPLQQQLMKKAASADDAQAKRAEFLMRQAQAYQNIAETATTKREALAAKREADAARIQYNNLLASIAQQNADTRSLMAQNSALQQQLSSSDRKDRQLGEGTQKLSKQLEDQVGVYTAVNQLNNRLGDYTTQGKTIPGIGLGSNMSLGPLDLSARFIGEEGRLNRAMAQKVLNKIINAESGQSVSTQEAARQLLASMGGSNFTEDDFLNAWEKNILPGVNASITNIGAGYSPEVKQRYKQQGGEVDFSKSFTAPERKSALPKATGAASAKQDAGGLSAQEQQELEALRKRFGR